MAPAATSSAPTSTSSPTASASASSTTTSGLGTASIVAITIFILFVVIAILSGTLFYLNRRRQHAKLPPHQRPTSTYRPYRSSSSKSKSASSGLLANAETPTSAVDDKASMFSRDSATLSLYVPEEHEGLRRSSTSSMSLVPIIVSPADEGHDPFSPAGRRGRGMSIRSGNEEQDLGVARGRVRSASTASARYYDSKASATPPLVPALPPS
ncbi:hypothetical protein BU16DRAFT_377239 [Lophium mytilinum]|uniref:Uncharacterized protein n=1 Tax=Lophium mytilinum TaxID=390894 RepID=A0A6A6QV84_9PEZI|nr:hypothetical protein BU16DRAFT_377239 [Lophium mytilinum]